MNILWRYFVNTVTGLVCSSESAHSNRLWSLKLISFQLSQEEALQAQSQRYCNNQIRSRASVIVCFFFTLLNSMVNVSRSVWGHPSRNFLVVCPWRKKYIVYYYLLCGKFWMSLIRIEVLGAVLPYIWGKIQQTFFAGFSFYLFQKMMVNTRVFLTNLVWHILYKTFNWHCLSSNLSTIIFNYTSFWRCLQGFYM